MKRLCVPFINKEQGVVSIEVALIAPVLFFIILMFFELARIALLVTVVSFSLERSLQDFRSDAEFYTSSDGAIKQILVDRVIAHSFDMVDSDGLKVELQSFENLNDFAGIASKEPTSGRVYPLLSFTVLLKEKFITPLPELFGLGDSFQHEFRPILGDLIGSTHL